LKIKLLKEAVVMTENFKFEGIRLGDYVGSQVEKIIFTKTEAEDQEKTKTKLYLNEQNKNTTETQKNILMKCWNYINSCCRKKRDKHKIDQNFTINLDLPLQRIRYQFDIFDISKLIKCIEDVNLIKYALAKSRSFQDDDVDFAITMVSPMVSHVFGRFNNFNIAPKSEPEHNHNDYEK